MPRNLTLLMAAVALVLPTVAAGCGGGNNNGGGGGGTLSAADNLKIAQDRADLDEFCSLSAGSHTGDLYDRAFFSAVDATDQMVLIYKHDPKAIYHDALKNRDLKLKQVLAEAAKKLNTCGKDGKVQAQKLTQALQSG